MYSLYYDLIKAWFILQQKQTVLSVKSADVIKAISNNDVIKTISNNDVRQETKEYQSFYGLGL